MDLVGEINEEDCLNYIIEAMRLIGGANYPEKACVLNIRNNTATLPDDFYVIDKVWLCSETMQPTNEINTIWFTKESRVYRGNSIMFPGDAMTGTSYSKHPNHMRAPIGGATYIIRHPKQFRCSLATADVGLTYVGMPLADNGEFVIQDEINTLVAAKAYAKKQLLSEKFYMGQVPQFVWQDITREWDQHADQAQAIFKFPDPADDEARGFHQDNRYNAFNLR
jgi:hypothetical protein